jgi:hypothetical protein
MERVFFVKNDIYNNFLKYYNCRTAQILIFLLEKKKLLPSLFFNSFESTETIYQNLFLYKIDRWHYKNEKIINNLINSNIKTITSFFRSYNEIEQYLIGVFQGGVDTVFVWGNNDFLPNRTYGKDYHDKGSLHSVFLKGYKTIDEKKYFLLEDNSPPFSDYIESQVVSDFMLIKTPSHKKNVMFLDYIEAQNIYQGKILEELFKYLNTLEGNSLLYDKIGQIVVGNNISKKFISQNEIFNYLSQAFSMISGSRFLFSIFMENVINLSEIVYILRRSSDLANNLFYIFYKASVLGKINEDGIMEKCRDLKNLDIETLTKLRQLLKT